MLLTAINRVRFFGLKKRDLEPVPNDTLTFEKPLYRPIEICCLLVKIGVGVPCSRPIQE